MRTAIYGAGSLGTIMGAYLTKAGVPVELINRNKKHVEALQQKGATLKGPSVSELTSEPDSFTFSLGKMDGVPAHKLEQVKSVLEKCVRLKASMLQDLEKGKLCEINAINGVVCRFGKKYHVPTPYNDKVVEVLRRMEKGERKPGLENLSFFENM